MSEQNKALDQRFFEEVWNRQNYAVIDELVANDFIGHSPPDDDVIGPEGVKQFYITLHAAFPDLQVTINDQFAEGNTVVSRWTAHATHRGEFNGIPPTGNQASVTGISIASISNGMFVEAWTNWDALGLFVQLGVVPAPEKSG